MKNPQETLEIYARLKQFLRIKSPDIISLKSVFFGFGFPNDDYRCRDNFANIIERNLMSGKFKEDYKSLLGEPFSYNRFLNWVIKDANHDQLNQLFSDDIFGKIEKLFFVDNEVSSVEHYEEILDYNLYDFVLDNLNHPIAKDKDFRNEYFNEIAQVSDHLVLLKKQGWEEGSRRIYDINGKCVSDLIRIKVFEELDEEHENGEELIFKAIDKDNSILVEQVGFLYQDMETITYLFQWNGSEIELINIVDDNFRLDTEESEILATEVSNLFVKNLKG